MRRIQAHTAREYSKLQTTSWLFTRELIFRRIATLAVFFVITNLAVVLSPTSSSAQGAADRVPASQIDAAIEQIDGLASTILSETAVPGLAVAVVHQGKRVFAKGYGVREIGKSEPIEVDTVFQIASLSKSISASVVAQQVGEGKLAWDDPVKKYLPWFQLQDSWISDHVTVGDFFAHRSGLPDHAGDDLDDLGFDRRAILERLEYLPLHAFRNTYAYTNYGLTAAAEATAAASGTDWASLSETAIYEPLGMASTSSRFEDFMARDNRAVGHAWVDGAFKPIKQRMPDRQSPAGGVSSTISDLSRWMIMMLSQGSFEGKPIIDEAALLPAMTPEIISRHATTPSDLAGFYGYGIQLAIRASGRTMLSHSGAFVLGAATNYVMLPSEELGIVVFTNGAPIGAAETLTAQFMDIVQYGEVKRDWLAGYRERFAAMTAPIGEFVGQEPPANPEPSAELTVLEGSYESDYFGAATLELQNGALVLALGPDRQPFELKHWNGNVFYFPVFNESMPSGSISSLAFDMSDDGVAKSFTVEFLNEFKLAIFDRDEQ